MKIDRLDEAKLYHVEGFSIQGLLEGRIARATHQTGFLVPRAIFPFRSGLQCIVSNFCIRTWIEMIYI